MNRVKNGATIWARQTIESDIFYWKPPAWFKIWFYIVSKVNHTDTKLFKRGTNYFCWSEDRLYLKKVTPSSYHECIKWLKSQKQITTQKTTRGNIITVCNYALYQNLQSYKSEAEPEAFTKASPKQVRSKSDTINKYVKNERNILNNGKLAKPVDLQTSIQQKLEKRQPRTQWEEKAFRYADALSINLSGDVMGRWLKIFRDADQNGGNIKLDRAYSYLRDYQKPITNDGKVKLFFWAYAHNGGINS